VAGFRCWGIECGHEVTCVKSVLEIGDDSAQFEMMPEDADFSGVLLFLLPPPSARPHPRQLHY
jgi:hypothetical protein